MLLAAREEPDEGLDAPEVAQLDVRRPRRARPRTRSSSAPAAGRSRLDVAEWLVGTTDGNPLALLEFTAALTEGQAAGVEPILPRCPSARTSSARSSSGCAGCRPPVSGCCWSPPPTRAASSTTVLDAAARLDVAAEALDEAERAGLIRVRGMTLELRHPLVRSAIYQGAPLSRRRAAHGALAAVLVGETRADRRAWHRAAASVDPEPGVVDELEGAARRAQARGGYDAASLAYERAAALTPTSADARACSPPRPRAPGFPARSRAPWRCCAGRARRAASPGCAPRPIACAG